MLGCWQKEERTFEVFMIVTETESRSRHVFYSFSRSNQTKKQNIRDVTALPTTYHMISSFHSLYMDNYYAQQIRLLRETWPLAVRDSYFVRTYQYECFSCLWLSLYSLHLSLFPVNYVI